MKPLSREQRTCKNIREDTESYSSLCDETHEMLTRKVFVSIIYNVQYQHDLKVKIFCLFSLMKMFLRWEGVGVGGGGGADLDKCL